MNPLLGTMLNNNPMMQNIGAIKNLMNCRNPSDVMREMLKNNPRFSQFVNENKCLTPEQIAQKYGIDFQNEPLRRVRQQRSGI